ncbi:thiamine kinase [Leclercia adecarboxylata]|uniref:thiamine kinase n=1 Tax=Leclercia adecarboxylata TaxID=83655 RepID=UPI002DC04412|nr:thiamine kinase [Leclercia adecarboxylata]MEB6378893.1 thiamine kinase [Leclercia adecarboxylata]
MQFSNSNLTRDALLSRFFPQFRIVAPPTHAGLSGASCIIEDAARRLVLRQSHAALATPAHFRRQYHALRHLPADIAPQPHFYSPGWIAVDYLPGIIKTTLPAAPVLAAMLYHLHQQPLFGWRITLMPLLEQYWLQSSPSRRTPLWLRWYKRLLKRGEPRPLRLAPLHMDVHAGNIVHTEVGSRLLDWEYAGDGDVALELASVWTEGDAERQALLIAYAQAAQIDLTLLQRQVTRWRPWVLMLMAGWFELRWQQSQDKQFMTLADEIWRQLETTE